MTQIHQDIELLNAFLRGELSAVETYSHCIDKVVDANVVGQLKLLQASHRRRAEVLALRVRELGGAPAETSGLWGGFAKAVQNSAGIFGEKAAISVLEEGEDHGLNDYEREKAKLSLMLQRFIEVEILPEQVRSHDILRGIERAMKAN